MARLSRILEVCATTGLVTSRSSSWEMGSWGCSTRFLPKGAPPFHMEVCSTLEDVDALHDQVLAAGLEPDGPPANRSWGSEPSTCPTQTATGSSSTAGSPDERSFGRQVDHDTDLPLTALKS